MNEDFTDLLQAFTDLGVRFLVVGAHALAVHGHPRATGDLDVWVPPDRDNAARVWAALQRFGAPIEATGIVEEDFATPGIVVQVGLPPRRIDLLTAITGVKFEDAWPRRTLHPVGGLEIPFIGREDLLMNKRATGCAQDLADAEFLENGPR